MNVIALQARTIGRDYPSWLCEKLPSHVSAERRRKRDSIIKRCKIIMAASVGSGRDMFLFVMMLLRHFTISTAFIYLACLE